MSGTEETRTHRHTHVTIILLTVVATLLAVYVWQHPRQTVAQVEAPAASLSALQNDFTAVAEKVTPAVVNISTNRKIKVRTPGFDFNDDFFGPFFRDQLPFGEQEQGNPPREFEREMPALGSGFIFRPDGYILTNNHVVEGADEIKVKLENGKEYKGTLKGSDPRTELAVVKIDAGNGLPILSLGDSDTAKVGQWVMAVGSPFEYQSSVTAGIVSAKGRSLHAESGPYSIVDLIQTDAAINPGNSGGPLVNLKGEVIGISVAIAGPIRANVGIGFAIPVNTVKAVVDDLVAGKRIVRGWLGVGITDLTEETKKATKAEEGIFVTEVRAGSPADEGGIEPGDVITEYNGQKLTEADELSKVVAATEPGTTAQMKLIREGKAQTIQVKIGKMPDRFAGFREPDTGEAAQEPRVATSKALGMIVQPIDDQLKKQYKLPDTKGVVITAVDPRGPAAAAGLEPGAVILKVGAKEIKGMADYEGATKGAKDSVTMIVRIEEGGQAVKRIVNVKAPE